MNIWRSKYCFCKLRSVKILCSADSLLSIADSNLAYLSCSVYDGKYFGFQFAGSSSVPAHVEMMGFLGIGNNPMVGCTVACAVDVATALSK